MKLLIKGPQKDNTTNLMRKIGYFSQNESFIRPLSRIGYPRFHIYLETDSDDLIISLHLDQKKAIYKGTTAHSGEYDSDLVEQEAQRIKEML